MLRERLGLCERWACRIVGQHRSTQRHQSAAADDDAALRAELRAISSERPRWGYRRAHARLRDLGWSVNRKRVQRLWREEGLRVPRRRRKRQRLGESTVPAARLRAQWPGHVWALDFQFDQTADGRVLKLLHVVDAFPEHIRCDNGPELTAQALRDWCRFARTATAFIEPGSPWQNPYVESFGARVRDELLDVEQFSCLAEARVVIGDWREDYNHRRPHSALAMQPPAAVAAEWTPATPPEGPR
jgi:putative transposase